MMDFNDVIRGFFGFRRPSQLESCDENCLSDFDCKRPSCHGRLPSTADPFFGDDEFFNGSRPMNLFSIFQQMEDALNNLNFFSFHSDNFPTLEEPPHSDGETFHHGFFLDPLGTLGSDIDQFFSDGHQHKGFSEFPNVESFHQPQSPRDYMLKPSDKNLHNSDVVKPGKLQDNDLDSSFLEKRPSNGFLNEFAQQPTKRANWSFSKSVSVKTIRGADGTLEEHRTVRDSSGNEVTTVRKALGDQSYTVTLHKDNEGLKEKKEDLINLDENDLPQFEERWQNRNRIHSTPRSNWLKQDDSTVQYAPGEQATGDPYYSSIFEKLFKF